MLTAVVTILIFLVLISLHEFGHFITAKLSGVSVLEFSIGMGPAIFKRQSKETLYSIRLLPIGGYCKLEGEDVQSDDPKAFCNQKIYKRFLVIASGAILNIILGFIVFVLITAIGTNPKGTPNTINTPVIDTIIENSYLENSGVKAGDKIIGIDGHKINFYNDIALYTDKFVPEQKIELTVKRDGQKLDFIIIPSLNEIEYIYNNENIVVKNSINGVVNEEVYEYTNPDIANEVAGQTAFEKRMIIGFTPKQEVVGINNIFSYSFHYTGYVVRMVYKAFWDMITGEIGLESMSGPVGIVSAVNDAVNTGSYRLINVLFLVALLTINLGVFNLLPIPALDGGRLFFLIIELIRRKPIPSEKEGMVHAIGLILLLALTLFISFNDILKLFK